MPPRRAVELRVGGQTYRVVATEDDQHVQRLAALVDRKYAEIVPQGQGRGVTAQQGMFLTALALAEEVEEHRNRAARVEGERDRAFKLANRAREVVARLLARVDSALSSLPPAPSAAAPASENARDLPPPAAAHASLFDAITDPPDALNEPIMIELLAPSSRDPRPALSQEQANEAGVPRAPRGPLRLVRQSSPSDDDSR